MFGIFGAIVMGFIASIVARLLVPGPTNPSGLVLTMITRIIGAFVATFLRRAIGLYGANQGAGFIALIIGAVIVLSV